MSVTEPSDAIKPRYGKTDRGTSNCAKLFGWLALDQDLYLFLVESAGLRCNTRTNERTLSCSTISLSEHATLTHLSVLLRQLSLSSAPLTNQNETHQRSDTGAQQGSCRKPLTFVLALVTRNTFAFPLRYQDDGNMTYLPTYLHTYLPGCLPVCLPTHLPACLPTYLPTYIPTNLPTYQPTNQPTNQPTT